MAVIKDVTHRGQDQITAKNGQQVLLMDQKGRRKEKYAGILQQQQRPQNRQFSFVLYCFAATAPHVPNDKEPISIQKEQAVFILNTFCHKVLLGRHVV